MATTPDIPASETAPGNTPPPVSTDEQLQTMVPDVKAALSAAVSQRTPEADAKNEVRKILEIVQQAAETYPALIRQHPEAAPDLTRHILAALVKTPGALDALQDKFPYADNTQFYDVLMEQGSKGKEWQEKDMSSDAIEGLAKRCQVNRANMRRRGWDLDGAMRDFEDLLTFVEEKTQPGLPSKGLIKYEIGYIHYLKGEFDEATQYLSESATDDAAVGREIGSLISQSVLTIVKYKTGKANFKEVRAFFEGAMEKFRQKSEADPNALRWVMNSRAHLFDVAVLQGDRELAEDLSGKLETDPWIAKNPGRVQKEVVSQRQASLTALQGNNEAAIQHLKQLAPALNSTDISTASPDLREGAADQYLLAGDVTASQGDKEQARKIWEYALTLPPEHGNILAQEKIRAKLKTV